MHIHTVQQWSTLIAELKTFCQREGVNVKASTLKRIMADTFCDGSENKLIALLPKTLNMPMPDIAANFCYEIEKATGRGIETLAAFEFFCGHDPIIVDWQAPDMEWTPAMDYHLWRMDPLPASISLNIHTGVVTVVTGEESKGMVRCYPINEDLKGEAIERLLSDPEILRAMKMIRDGMGSVWGKDGWEANPDEMDMKEERGLMKLIEGSIDEAVDCLPPSGVGDVEKYKEINERARKNWANLEANKKPFFFYR